MTSQIVKRISREAFIPSVTESWQIKFNVPCMVCG